MSTVRITSHGGSVGWNRDSSWEAKNCDRLPQSPLTTPVGILCDILSQNWGSPRRSGSCPGAITSRSSAGAIRSRRPGSGACARRRTGSPDALLADLADSSSRVVMDGSWGTRRPEGPNGSPRCSSVLQLVTRYQPNSGVRLGCACLQDGSHYPTIITL